MSEEHNKDVSNNIIEEDDPLAELARIVAGEISSPEEIEDSTPTEAQAEPDLSAQDDDIPNFDDMLSVELEPEEVPPLEQPSVKALPTETISVNTADASTIPDTFEAPAEVQEFDSLEDDLVAVLDVPEGDDVSDLEINPAAVTEPVQDVSETSQFDAPSEIQEDETTGFDSLEETQDQLEEELVANLSNIELEITQPVEETSIAAGFDPLTEDNSAVEEAGEFMEEATEIPVAEAAPTTSMQLDELIEETVMADLSQSTFEDELSSHLESELVDEPTGELEIEEEVFEEQFAATSTSEDLERMGEALDIQHEPEPLLEDNNVEMASAPLEEAQEYSAPQETGMAADLEQEMSAAFDNAVEHTQNFSNAISEETDAFSSRSEDAQQSVEIDFETAFAEELSIKEREAAGWNNSDT